MYIYFKNVNIRAFNIRRFASPYAQQQYRIQFSTPNPSIIIVFALQIFLSACHFDEISYLPPSHILIPTNHHHSGCIIFISHSDSSLLSRTLQRTCLMMFMLERNNRNGLLCTCGDSSIAGYTQYYILMPSCLADDGR